MRSVMCSIFILVAVVVSTTVGYAKGVDLDALWRPTEGTLLNAMRSNAPHYWAYARKNALKVFAPGQLIEGVVTGDPHIGNFGDTLISGHRVFALIDLDDGGTGPLVLDFAKFVAMTKAQNKFPKKSEMFEAYVDGLLGRSRAQPDALRAALSVSGAQERAESIRATDRMAPIGANGRRAFALNDLELIRLSDAPFDKQALFRSASRDLEAAMPAGRTLDVAYKVHKSGGSQGLVRFWFLRESNLGNLEIFEFKLMDPPALANWGAQKSQESRVAELSLIYRSDLSDLRYQIVSAGGKKFWLRPRGVEFMQLGKDPQVRVEVQLYIAYWMGIRHGSQSASLVRLVSQKSSRSDLETAISSWVDRYIQKASDLNSENRP